MTGEETLEAISHAHQTTDEHCICESGSWVERAHSWGLDYAAVGSYYKYPKGTCNRPSTIVEEERHHQEKKMRQSGYG